MCSQAPRSSGARRRRAPRPDSWAAAVPRPGRRRRPAAGGSRAGRLEPVGEPLGARIARARSLPRRRARAHGLRPTPDSPASGRRLRRGPADGRDDPRVGAAAAHVAVHRAGDLRLAGIGRSPQQRHARHDHARRAVAALHRVDLEERLLDGVQPAVLLEPFDGGDRLAGRRGRGRDAGAGGPAVDQHGAGAALALAAAVLGAGQVELVAQDASRLWSGPISTGGGAVHEQVHVRHGSSSRYYGAPVPLFFWINGGRAGKRSERRLGFVVELRRVLA